MQCKSTNAVHQVPDQQICEYAWPFYHSLQPDMLLRCCALLWLGNAVDLG